jgi:hypothetical protein
MSQARRFALVAVLGMSLAGITAATSQAAQVLPLTRCFNGGSATIPGGDAVTFTIAWVTPSPKQAQKFLESQNLTVSITAPNGTTATLIQSATGTTAGLWSSVYPSTLQGKPAYRTDLSITVGFGFVPGTYLLGFSGNVVSTVYDGTTAIRPGPWLTVTCAVHVV